MKMSSNVIALALVGSASAADVAVLDVSYDPTRKLYLDLNSAFIKHPRKKTGNTTRVPTR